MNDETSASIADKMTTFVRRQVKGTPAETLFKATPLWSLMRPRRFHLYCLGAPKTGTTSIARLFEKNYRAQHEPGMEELTPVLQAVKDGAISQRRLRGFLRRHDRRFRLEVESSHPLAMLADVLVQVFPEAKFIITVRDCYAWLDSMINHQLRDQYEPDPTKPAYWKRVNDLYFGKGASGFGAGDRVLERMNLYPLESYLSFWATHYQQVLDATPQDRTLMLRTERLSHEVDQIARFAGVAVDTLDNTKSHSHKTQTKYHVVEQIDPQYLAEKVEEHCHGLMQRLFPEMTYTAT